MPESIDIETLRKQFDAINGTSPASMRQRVWIQAGIGRAWLLRNQLKEADLAFTLSEEYAKGASDVVGQARVKAIRAQLTAVYQLRYGNYEAAMEAAGDYFDRFADLGPSVLPDIVRVILCLQKREPQCAASAWSVVRQTMERPNQAEVGLWLEELQGLIVLGEAFAASGNAELGASVLEYVIPFLDAEPERHVRLYLRAQQLLNETGYYFMRTESLSKSSATLVAKWGAIGAETIDNVKDDERKHALLKTRQQLQLAALTEDVKRKFSSGDTEAKSAIDRLLSFVSRLGSDFDTEQESNARQVAWRYRVLQHLREQMFEETLEAFYEDAPAEPMNVRERFLFNELLAHIHIAMGLRRRAAAYSDAIPQVDLLKAGRGAFRRRAAALHGSGSYEAATEVLLALVDEARLSLAERLGYTDAELYWDVAALFNSVAYSTQRDQKQAALAVIQKLKSLLPQDPKLPLMTAGLDALAQEKTSVVQTRQWLSSLRAETRLSPQDKESILRTFVEGRLRVTSPETTDQDFIEYGIMLGSEMGSAIVSRHYMALGLRAALESKDGQRRQQLQAALSLRLSQDPPSRQSIRIYRALAAARERTPATDATEANSALCELARLLADQGGHESWQPFLTRSEWQFVTAPAACPKAMSESRPDESKVSPSAGAAVPRISLSVEQVAAEAASIAEADQPETESTRARVLLEKIRLSSMSPRDKERSISAALAAFDRVDRPFAPGALALARAPRALDIRPRAAVTQTTLLRIAALAPSSVAQVDGLATEKQGGTLATTTGKAGPVRTEQGRAGPTSATVRPMTRFAAFLQVRRAAADVMHKHKQKIDGGLANAAICDAARTDKAIQAIAAAKKFLATASDEPDDPYRLSQIELICGTAGESEKYYGLTVEAALTSPSPERGIKFMAWRANDLAQVGNPSAAHSIRTSAVSLLQALLQRVPAADLDISLSEVARAVEAFVLAKDAAGVAAIVVALDGTVCAEARHRCARIYRLAAFSNAANAERGDGVQAAARALASTAHDPVRARVALEVAESALLRALADGRNSQVDVLLDEAIKPLVAKFNTETSIAGEHLLGVAYVSACRRRGLLAMNLAAMYAAERREQARELQDAGETAVSEAGLPPNLQLSVSLHPIYRRIASDRALRDEWTHRRLPLLLNEAASGAVPLDRRIHALFLGDEQQAALKLFMTRLDAMRKADTEPKVLRSIAFGVSTALLEGVESDNLPASMELLSFLDGRLGTLTSPDQFAVARIKRLLAESAFRRGRSDLALSILMELQATSSRAMLPTRSLGAEGQTQTADASPLHVLLVEDLRSAVLQTSGRGLFNKELVTLAGDRQSARAMRQEQSLREAQRSLLALLLVRNASASHATTGRADLAFQILQAATAGPTAIDLARSLDRGTVEDPDLRRAYDALVKEFDEPQFVFSKPRLDDDLTNVDDLRQQTIARGCGPKESDSSRSTHLFSDQYLQVSEYTGRRSRLGRRPTAVGDTDPDPPEPRKTPLSEEEQRLRGYLLKDLEASPLFVRPITLSEAKTRLNGARALYFAVTHEHATYIFLLTPRGQFLAAEARLRDKPLGTAALEGLLKRAWNDETARAAGRRSALNGAPSRILYEALFGAFREQLRGVDEVVVATRGPLEEFPLGILRVAPTPEAAVSAAEFFDERFAWSVGLVGAKRDKTTAVASDVLATREVIQFGPPRFEGRGPMCGALPVNGASGTPIDLSKALCDISPLESLAEASFGQTAKGAPRLTTIAASQATKSTLVALSQQQRLAKARVLILATHGLLPQETKSAGGPLEPSLVLGKDVSSVHTNELLTPSEIAKLDIGADEVVLMACHSAAASPDSDERAFSGLVRGFLKSGAKGVIAALFAIPRDSTAVLLERYFEGRQSGLSPARAMQEAKRFVRRAGGALASPEHWAGMVHIGAY